jgi:hypothetical protein
MVPSPRRLPHNISPLEGDGFELSVPRYKRCFLTLPIRWLGASRNCAEMGFRLYLCGDLDGYCMRFFSGHAMSKNWVAVASAEHVRLGRSNGFMQVSHGKSAPLRRIEPGDRVVFSRPRTQATASGEKRAVHYHGSKPRGRIDGRQSLRRRKGTSVCLWMSGVEPLVIGGTDEGLQRIAELHRMLSADVQIKRVASLEPFNQLEMVGYIVP